jgi:phage shock protein B
LDLSALIAIAVILFIVIPAPLFIVLHYITRWKQSREMSNDDEQMLQDLWKLSQRLEERLDTLERILSDEVPELRSTQRRNEQ